MQKLFTKCRLYLTILDHLDLSAIIHIYEYILLFVFIFIYSFLILFTVGFN